VYLINWINVTERKTKINNVVCPLSDFELLFTYDNIQREMYDITEHFVITSDQVELKIFHVSLTNEELNKLPAEYQPNRKKIV